MTSFLHGWLENMRHSGARYRHSCYLTPGICVPLC